MVDIEKVNGRYKYANPVGDLKSTAGAFACDILELAELQGKLFKADAQAAIRQSIGASVSLLVACTCLLASLPVAMFGLASAVAFFFDMETWVAQLTVGGSLSILGIVIAAWAFSRLSGISHQFKRSSVEFSKNLAWTKHVFSGGQ
jgi:hypothetical protein